MARNLASAGFEVVVLSHTRAKAERCPNVATVADFPADAAPGGQPPPEGDAVGTAMEGEGGTLEAIDRSALWIARARSGSPPRAGWRSWQPTGRIGFVDGPLRGTKEPAERALQVGLDHVSATVNTLVLAYVGASLPALLIFSSTALDLGETLNSELVAQTIAATLVGSIGLIAAVPITTALAAFLSLNLPVEQLAGAEHGHVH